MIVIGGSGLAAADPWQSGGPLTGPLPDDSDQHLAHISGHASSHHRTGSNLIFEENSASPVFDSENQGWFNKLSPTDKGSIRTRYF